MIIRRLIIFCVLLVSVGSSSFLFAQEKKQSGFIKSLLPNR
jgi:hypothetical protein